MSPSAQTRVNAVPEAGAGTFTGRRAGLLLASLFLVSVFAQIDRILPFILAESIKAELSLSDTQLGLVTGIAFAVCYALLSLPLARVADRGSPRRLLVACTLLWSAMTALGGLATGFLVLAMTRLGVAIGEAGAVPAAHALIARRIRTERRGTAIGIFALGIPLGAMAGFGIGGAVNDAFGWRVAMLGAGALGGLVGLIPLVAVGSTPVRGAGSARAPAYLSASMRLLACPAFRWLFAGAVMTGLAAAPFYAFAAPYLIRTHGFSATEAGMAFGLLQGLTGIVGTLLGGRSFDRAARAGTGYLRLPAALFLLASATMLGALMVPTGWVAVTLMAPAMFAFAFVVPNAFGSAHLVARSGNEAMASSLVLMGTSLIGPAFGPLIVGIVSDWATRAGLPNGLGIGLLIVPMANVGAALTCLQADRRISRRAPLPAQRPPDAGSQ